MRINQARAVKKFIFGREKFEILNLETVRFKTYLKCWIIIFEH